MSSKSRVRVLLWSTAFFSSAVFLSFSQTAQEGPRPRDGGTREVLVSIFIPSVANAPFSATVNTESIRQLGDGSRINW
jgi:hypothetical protein